MLASELSGLCKLKFQVPKSMDSDLWISRLAAAKRHYSNQQKQGVQADRFNIDEFEMEEEARGDFACPYCYEDHDIASLCSHLEEEHAFESTAAVCPICSVKVTKDMLNHITVQHRQIFKLQRRRRLRRFAIPSSQSLSLLGRDLREAHLHMLLGSANYRLNSNDESNISSDSFLSSLLMNFPTSDVEETTKPTDDSSNRKKESNLSSSKLSFNSSLTHEQKEQRQKQATTRATFVQDLLLSTLFDD